MADFYEIKNNYEDFIHSYNESTKLSIQYYNLKKFGTSRQLEKFLSMNNIQETYDRDYAVYELIFNYTLPYMSKSKLENYSNWVKKYDPKCKVIFGYNDKYNTKELSVKCKDYRLKAIMFSSISPSIKREYPQLETVNRANYCFDNSFELVNTLGLRCNLVTGTVKGIVDRADFLHSWVETTLHGEEVVIDYTMNAIINKEGYYKFRHAKAMEKISVDDIVKDSEKYGKIFDLIDIKTSMYNIFRDEIISDFEKNNYDQIVKKVI